MSEIKNDDYKIELDKCINDYINILHEYNNNTINNIPNNSNFESLILLIKEPSKLIHIMMNFADIDKELNNISVFVKLDVYWFLFNEEIYDMIYNDVAIRNDDFVKYYFNSAILVELVKYRIVENLIESSNNHLTKQIDTIDSNILQSMILTFEEKLEICKRVIQKLYDWIKLYFQDNDIQNVDKLLNINNITFVTLT